WAATLRTATVQKQLGKDAELAATELVRRAERAIGQGIRAGQEAGEIADRGYKGKPSSPYTRIRNGAEEHIQPQVPDTITTLPSPRDFLGHAQERVDVYAMTDDVSEEEFEQAISDAKDEGNLSRANVVRHIKPDKAPKPTTDRHPI